MYRTAATNGNTVAVDLRRNAHVWYKVARSTHIGSGHLPTVSVLPSILYGYRNSQVL
jgi:hypothetical protein